MPLRGGGAQRQGDEMRPSLLSWSGVVALLCGGCMSGPLLDNPGRVAVSTSAASPNPVWIHQACSPEAYNLVFEKVYDILSEYFEVSFSNRYDGRIETFPRIAPGLEQPWKPGSPDFSQRLLATLQTIRHRAIVLIQPADDGGYFVNVKVFGVGRPGSAIALHRRRCLVPQRQHPSGASSRSSTPTLFLLAGFRSAATSNWNRFSSSVSPPTTAAV